MQPRSAAYLHDILVNAGLIRRSVAGKTLSDYQTDIRLRHQIEREVTIIGDAVARLTQTDAEVSAAITSTSGIIAFRNTIVHEYEELSDETVWIIIQEHLPILIREAEALLLEDF
jgi:uncharacterized protein with HEPN domain